MPRPKRFDKDEVLEKAMHLFWEQGYNATSMQDLVTGLGINRASLYDTFGGKRDLFLAAFARYRNLSGETLSRAFGAGDRIKDAFRKLLMEEFETQSDGQAMKGCFVVNSTTELANSDPEFSAIIAAHREMAVSAFQSYIAQGQARGEISADKDSRALANYIFTFFSGLRVISKMQLPYEELEHMVDTALSMLD